MSDLRWYPPELIDEAGLDSGIRDLPRFGTVRYSVGTDSTQSRALDVLHGFDGLGISFVTESQDAGRGRGAHRWIAPPASGLLFSTVLPKELRSRSLPAVGFWASLIIVDSVASVSGITLSLKWPNDVLLDGRKCGGILSEGRSMGERTRVALGVGLNVNRPEYVPPGIANAAWLSDATGRAIDRTALLVAILQNYEQRFDTLTDTPASVINTWRERAALTGKQVSVKAPDGTTIHEGRVIDVADDGALLLDAGGRTERVLLGDIDAI